MIRLDLVRFSDGSEGEPWEAKRVPTAGTSEEVWIVVCPPMEREGKPPAATFYGEDAENDAKRLASLMNSHAALASALKAWDRFFGALPKNKSTASAVLGVAAELNAALCASSAALATIRREGGR